METMKFGLDLEKSAKCNRRISCSLNIHSFDAEFRSTTEAAACNIKKLSSLIKNNNKYVNLKQHAVLKNVISMTDEENETMNDPNVSTFVDLQQSLLISNSDENSVDNLLETSQKKEHTSDIIEDMINVAIENYSFYGKTSDQLLQNIKICEEIERFFSRLSESDIMDDTQITDLGFQLLETDVSHETIDYYCKKLLFPKVINKGLYSNIVMKLIHLILKNDLNLFSDIIVKKLLTKENDNIQKIFGLLKKLPNDFNTSIMRQFLENCLHLNEKYLEVISEFYDLNIVEKHEEFAEKLIIIMAEAAQTFNKNSVFGKIVYKTVSFLKNDLSNVEEPLNIIVNCHQSIWKGKLKNRLEELYF